MLPQLALISAITQLIKEGVSYIQENRSHTYEEITYGDLIKEIVEKKPDNPTVDGCAVLKETRDGMITMTIVYLDSDMRPIWKIDEKPCGFRKMTQKLDAELLDAFGDQDLIIFN